MHQGLLPLNATTMGVSSACSVDSEFFVFVFYCISLHSVQVFSNNSNDDKSVGKLTLCHL